MERRLLLISWRTIATLMAIPSASAVLQMVPLVQPLTMLWEISLIHHNTTNYGVDNFSYTISDGKGGTSTASIKVNLMRPFTWTGNTSNATNTNANWCGTSVTNPGLSGVCVGSGLAPSSGDIIVFDGSCSSPNCSPNMTSALSVNTIDIQSTFTGTITQNGNAITVSGGAFKMAGGIFVGGSANISLVAATEFSLTGTSQFTATSSNLSLSVSSATITPQLFNHNSGSVYFTGSSVNFTISNSVIFNNLHLNLNGAVSNFNGSIFSVNGTLNLNAASSGARLNNTTINVNGALSSSGSFGMPGSAVIKMVGSYTYLSGFLSAGTSTLEFSSPTATPIDFIPGTASYYNLTFSGVGNQANPINMGGGFANINGVLTMNSATGSAYISNGLLNVYGNNVVASNLGMISATNASIVLAGTGAQTVSGSSAAYIPNLTINNPIGAVTLSGNLKLSGTYTWINGSMTTTGSTLTFDSPTINSYLVTFGPVTYNNVTFAANSSTLYSFNSFLFAPSGAVNSTAGAAINMSGFALDCQSMSLSGAILTKGTGALTVNSVTQGTGALFGGTVNP